MSDVNTISVTILGKTYSITCSADERELLNDAVQLLNDKMHALKASGKTIGSERLAVLAALNIAHEMAAYKQQNEVYTSDVDTLVRRMRHKIDSVLVNHHAVVETTAP